ncbi:pyridoxamine 5'-phosphate oxidase [Massilia sp. MP_M2]|uniref:pyridoxamine 5'-phosphate oxidase n=1 Tax=Massilia sp. MP_M2 TaxID=3071713 RepID=UPI00319DE673
MTSLLPDTAPDFSQPIAVLKHCHDRIRKQLSTLEKLLPHLAEHGVDKQARDAAGAVLRYFDKAAHMHHDDEEQDLIPMLRATAQGDDAATLQALAPTIVQDHNEMDALWQDLHEQLRAIEAGTGTMLSSTAVEHFVARYTAHMAREESTLAPMALRLFSLEQMAQLGQAMQRRRGLLAPEAFDQPVASATASATTSAKTAGVGQAVADLRQDYGQASLNEDDVLDDPIAQFTAWFEQALAAQVNEPNAMTLATVGPGNRPSSRIVLIKQFDPRGFTWYTNYDSQKAQELGANNQAALLFFWSELERQIRIEGRVEMTSSEESDHYFRSRPLKSRVAAIASQQSSPIASRAALEANYDAVAQVAGDDPARPANWGGFRLVPERIEFWQGRRSRFHDRIVYQRHPDGSWTRSRLQP